MLKVKIEIVLFVPGGAFRLCCYSNRQLQIRLAELHCELLPFDGSSLYTEPRCSYFWQILLPLS